MIKNYFIPVCACTILIFFSCGVGNNKNGLTPEQELNIRKDSIEQLRIASLEEIKIDSLAQYAWGEVKFGVSIKDAKNTKIFDNASISIDKSSPYSSMKLYYSETNIEGIDFIEASFYNDRLYRVDMESSYKTANYYDTQIKETILKLKNLVEEKYGKASFEKGFPEFFEMKPDKSIIAYSWTIGDKSIYIQVDEKYSGSEYRATCVIISEKESEPVAAYNEKMRNQKKSKEKNGF